MNRPYLFASDLHLSESDPQTVDAFLTFLRDTAIHAHSLYLLGDIFEYWAGDDDTDPLNARIAAALAAVSQGGTAVFLMHGNRDFLMGEAFATQAGGVIINDPTLIEAWGRRFVLSHGDLLCTDDVAYQQFRATVRQPAWQAAFLGQPLANRQAEITRIRQASQAAKRSKSSEIMDVNQAAVSKLLAQHAGAHLIHGHTHRPAQHTHEVQHGLRQRWVLPDWYAGKGGYLHLDENGPYFVGINQDAAWR